MFTMLSRSKTIFLTVLLLGTTVCVPINAMEMSGLMVGGPCAYNSYQGEATIVSVAPDPAGEPIDRYDITFSFKPDRPVQEPYAQTAGRTFLYEMTGSAYPTQAFVTDNKIAVGTVYKATMRVIAKGTCTPIIFDFPSFKW